MKELISPENLSPLQKAQEFQNYVRSDPSLMQQILNVSNYLSHFFIDYFLQNDPELATAVLSDDLNSLANLLTRRENLKRQKEAEELRKIVHEKI